MRPDQPQPRRPRPARRFNPGQALTFNPLMVIIIINVVFYLATMVVQPGQYPWGPLQYIRLDRITYYLGLIPYYLQDRPWTLVTAMFIHANFTHVLFNMIGLFFFGRTLKFFVGGNRFLFVYFLGGIIGNLAFLGLNVNELTL